MAPPVDLEVRGDGDISAPDAATVLLRAARGASTKASDFRALAASVRKGQIDPAAAAAHSYDLTAEVLSEQVGVLVALASREATRSVPAPRLGLWARLWAQWAALRG